MRARTKRPKRVFAVRIGNRSIGVEAKTPGAAARKAFKSAIRNGFIKNQPRSTEDGGWEGVTIT